MNTSTDLERRWARDERWAGITRPYTEADVERLRGTLPVEHTLAAHGARRLWHLLHETPYVAALSAVTGNQAIQEVAAGLPAGFRGGRAGAPPRHQNGGGWTPPHALTPPAR